MRIAPFTLLFLLCCTVSVQAATLSGTVYTQDLQVANFSVLTVNTTPMQRIILEDGTYNITVPRGSYTMRIEINIRGRLYDDELTVNIADNGLVKNTGNYTYDFILFPTNGNATSMLPESPVASDFESSDLAQGYNSSLASTPANTQRNVVAALLLIGLVIAVIVLSRKRWWERAEPRNMHKINSSRQKPRASATLDTPSTTSQDKTAETSPNKTVNNDTKGTTPQQPPGQPQLDEVIARIREEGGRTTQRELRKHIPYSEAKLSMMLTELEAKGRIEKIKKGRGNLIVLK